jgi:hypothetical protein
MKARTIPLTLALSVLCAAPAFAQSPSPAPAPPQADSPEAVARDGIAKLLQALKLFVDNLPQYAAPEIDAQGNIVIRRLNPPTARRDPPPPRDGDSLPL